MNGKPYTAQEINYVSAHYPDMKTELIAKHLGRPLSGIYRVAKKLKLYKSEAFRLSTESGRFSKLSESGKPYRYPKGHIPFNKGKKQIDYLTPEQIAQSAHTRFKSGHLPHNHKDSGDGTVSIRVDKRGIPYYHIRVALGRWDYLHRYLWELHRNKIEPGEVVVFRDGNTMSCTLSNLEKITMAENAIRNRHNIQDFDELRILGNISKINKKIKEYEKLTNRP